MVGVRGFRPDLPEPYLNRFALLGLRSFGSFFIAMITLAIPVNKVPVATISSAISDIFIPSSFLTILYHGMP
jgi:hypothetical protein